MPTAKGEVEFPVSPSRRALVLPALVAVVAMTALSTAQAEDWAPVTPQELSMTSEPKAPGAPAVYLLREMRRSDNEHREYLYIRVKILREEGLKYGNVEIQFNKETERIREIEARTVRPDGSIAMFNGTVYEAPLAKSNNSKLMVKTFTLPEVQIGSIVEYRYLRYLPSAWLFNMRWVLSQDLYTEAAQFTLEPARTYPLRWYYPRGLPEGTDPPVEHGSKIHLETHDVPAFVTEEYMPPQEEMRYRVEFIYAGDRLNETDPAEYWKKYGAQVYDSMGRFIDDRWTIKAAVAQTVLPGDPPEAKLRKLYARSQQLRNTSYEGSKTEQEIERDIPNDARNIASVWRQGYGNYHQIGLLFLALARAAGFKADPIYVGTRDTYFFNQLRMNPYQLNAIAVVVTLDGQDWYLAPGTPHTPFGQLPWSQTAVQGLRLDAQGGTWISMPVPEPGESRIVRRAGLKLGSSGSLEGRLTITYTGQEALSRRLRERNVDAAERQKFLEEEVKASVASGADVTLTNSPDWNSSDPVFVAEFDISVPGWAASAGERLLLPVGLFGGGAKQTFTHAARVQPLYFLYPSQQSDDVSIELPAGWQVRALPKPRNNDLKRIAFAEAAEDRGGSLHLTRSLLLNFTYVEAKAYGLIHDFYQGIRTADAEQIVIASGPPGGKH